MDNFVTFVKENRFKVLAGVIVVVVVLNVLFGGEPTSVPV